MKKQILTLTLVVAALGIVVAVGAQPQPANSESAERAQVFAKRGGHATIEFLAEGAMSVELQGKVLDAQGRPLPKVDLQIVRFETDPSAQAAEEKAAPVPLEDLEREFPPYRIKESLAVTTSTIGDFELTSLLPGRYSLQIDWQSVPRDSDRVEWALRWVQKSQS